MTVTHLDMVAIEELKEVMEDEFPVLIETYLRDSVVRLDMIQMALERNDADALRKAAHSFKGSSGNIGACQLEQLCAQLEKLGNCGDVTEAQDLFPMIKSEYHEVKGLMKSILQ